MSLHAKAFRNPSADPNSCYVTRDAILGSTGINRQTYSDAVDYCSNLGLGGYTWQVPDILNMAEAEFLRGEEADGGAGLDFG